MQHALSYLDAGFVRIVQADLFSHSFTRKLLAVEPGVSRAQSRVAMNLVLNRLVDRENVSLLPELDTHRRPDTFCQAKVGVRVEQDQGQRQSSPCSAAASCIGMSMIC